MAMSTGGGGEDTPMSEINTTPLVDVMLVLLIIFLITIPVAVKTVELTLPDTVSEPTTTKAENILLNIRATPEGVCQVYWGQTPITAENLALQGRATLDDLYEELGGPENVTEETMPEVHIRGDINTPYRCVGGAIYMMQIAGFQKIGFISQPAPGSAVVQRL
jgi:biopolymer transport protein ExbD